MIRNITFSKIFFLLFFFTVITGKLFSKNKIESKKNSTQKAHVATKTLYGQASFYASKFEGRRTANGETFSHKKFTAACNSLPLGTWIKITNLKNAKIAVVKINDRLHKKTKRLVDLTLAGAKKLGFVSSGLTRVKVEVLKNYHGKQ